MLAALVFHSLTDIEAELWTNKVPGGSSREKFPLFVEFGASDGVRFSNTFLLERLFGWQGLLIEPNRSFHSELSKNRQVQLSHSAVGGANGQLVFQESLEHPFLSALRGQGDRSIPKSEPTKQYKVPVRTLAEILSTHQLPRNVFYLSMDVEGLEFEILQSGFLDNWNFGVISVETNKRPDEELVLSLLADSGYLHLGGLSQISGGDAWFVNKSIAPWLPSSILG